MRVTVETETTVKITMTPEQFQGVVLWLHAAHNVARHGGERMLNEMQVISHAYPLPDKSNETRQRFIENACEWSNTFVNEMVEASN